MVDLKTLKQGMEAIFAKHAPTAIAVKAQHAYSRTLNWIERNDVEASAALRQVLTQPAEEIECRNAALFGGLVLGARC